MKILLTGGTKNSLRNTYFTYAEKKLSYTPEAIYPGGVVNTDDYGALLLCGGLDIDPARFGEELLFDNVTIDTERDVMEMALFALFAEQKKPIYGICRGLQIINVALGGDLFQDLYKQCGVNHSGTLENPLYHEITTHKNENIRVNSFHHQAIKTLGEGLFVTAFSSDGVIEAVEHKTLPIKAVQWHPELLDI